MVIQRIQTLFLLIAAVMMGFFSFMSIAQINTEEVSYLFCSFGFQPEGVAQASGSECSFVAITWYLFSLSILSMILPFLNMFLFNNLNLQKRICLICILLSIATFFTAIALALYTFPNPEVLWSYSILIAPWIAVLALILAYRYISSDQKKLKSADRIR